MHLHRVFIFAQVLLFAIACQKSGERSSSKDDSSSKSEKSAGKGKGGGRNVGPAAVKVKTVEAKELPRSVEMVTVLAGYKQAEVYSRVAGKISYLGAEEGKRVKEGEVLFRVDRSDPGESFLATSVVSPISGWVGRWLVTSIGQQVVAQDAVVTVVDDDILRAQVLLPTHEWLQVSTSSEVVVKIGKESRKAKVTRIARAAESASGRGTVTVEIDNSDHRWKAGMVALVNFQVDIKRRIVIPAAAVAITDEGAFVFTVQDGAAKRLPVKFFVVNNDEVEILEGLSEGATLIIEGGNQVADSLPVKIVEDEKRT